MKTLTPYFDNDPLLAELKQCKLCGGTGVFTAMLPTGGGVPLMECTCGAYARKRSSGGWREAPLALDGNKNHVTGVYCPTGTGVEWLWSSDKKKVIGYRLIEVTNHAA